MLDTYVINKLVQWANWRARRLDGGLGYPKKSAFVNVRGGMWVSADESQCYEVDLVVCALLPERKDALMKCYTEIGTKEQKAKRCGCCVRTYDLRIDMAHRDMLGYLNDLAAGVPLPIVKVKYIDNFLMMEA